MPTEEDLPVFHVREDSALREICEGFRKAGAIGVDTEFVRVRTFFPMLGLIQVADKKHVYLIDPLALSDLSPFARVLTDRSVLKIFHSCSEDLEVLSYLSTEPLAPVVDTQVAASFLEYGYQVGYQALAKEVLGVEMGKGATRSDWLRRPLSDEQVCYAAMDVACLLPLRSELVRMLRKKGMLGWARQEFEKLRENACSDPEPEEYYLRLGGLWQFTQRDLGLLRDLFAWRENRAMTRDLPRGFVMQDKVLRRLAIDKPASRKELAEVEGIRPSDVRRHGRALLSILKRAEKTPEKELPEPVRKPPNPRKVGALVDKLRPVAAEQAEKLRLPPELLATKRALTDLAQNALRGLPDPWPNELSGWRRDALADKLDPLLP
ncbi:ribonuclease D [Desulfohalovibrio reitneri]|uniref:ribonuclease D n=1 Tax=Desulfohalovibrio reitneri TaxID=1307759 RepID=UPI0006892097|nr:ribonuclease D [Desulfohalovibrio reitneri]